VESITIKHIKDVYKTDLEEKIGIAVAYCNKKLLANYLQICQKGYVNVPISPGIKYANSTEIYAIVEYLQKIYPDWNVSKSGLSITFSAKNSIGKITLDSVKIKEESKPVSAEEVIDNRAEILDLRDK